MVIVSRGGDRLGTLAHREASGGRADRAPGITAGQLGFQASPLALSQAIEKQGRGSTAFDGAQKIVYFRLTEHSRGNCSGAEARKPSRTIPSCLRR